jgi:MFS family permease
LPTTDTPANDKCEATNFLWLAAHQILLRIGWIFKTESVVMPAFMDFVGGGPVLRGCLMVLNRLGFSIPPVLMARRLANLPYKKHFLIVSSLAMAVPFAILSWTWATGAAASHDGKIAAWMPYFFLLLYGAFFCATGLNQLAAQSLLGKLVRPDRRGRLFSLVVVVGSPLAILSAWWLLPDWLARADGGFGWIFAVIATCFVCSGWVAGRVQEFADLPGEHDQLDPLSPADAFRGAWDILHSDPNSRRLGVLALLFSSTFMLFPHYQSLARPLPTTPLGELMTWVCVQNASTAILGLFLGPIADRWGNRAALRITMLGAASAPLVALALDAAPREDSKSWMWLMFVPLGFTPVTIRFLMNYALEIVRRENHPRVVSAVGTCLALPVIVGAPLAGWLIGVVGTAPVMFLGAAILLVGGVQTWRLVEPRDTTTPPPSSTV